MHPEQVKNTLSVKDDDLPEVVKFDPKGYLTHIDIPIESNDTHLIGMVTTKDCYQARTLSSVQFIYASKERHVCD